MSQGRVSNGQVCDKKKETKRTAEEDNKNPKDWPTKVGKYEACLTLQPNRKMAMIINVLVGCILILNKLVICFIVFFF